MNQPHHIPMLGWVITVLASPLGIVILRAQFDPSDLSRTFLGAFMVGVWALHLWWSQAWLSSHRYGPAEWVWRVATYRHLPGG